MDDQVLSSFEELEVERTAILLAKLESKTGVTPRDFFPELILTPPYTLLNLHPFWLGLPYYGTQIYATYPFPNERAFERAAGASVAAVLSLVDAGRVQLLLAGPPRAYAGLHYLDPILRRTPPSYGYRIPAYLSWRCGRAHPRVWFEEGATLFVGKLRRLWEASRVATQQDHFEGSVVTAWVNLRAMAAEPLVRSIREIADQDPNAAAFFVEIYHELLCAPITSCLGGCHSAPAEYLTVHGNALRAAGYNLTTFHTDFAAGFPAEVGKLLIERYALVRPRSFDEALEVYPDYTEARAALRALTEYVSTSKTENVQTLASSVERAFKDVARIKARKKSVEFGVQMTGVLGAAAAGLVDGAVGFLNALGFGLIGSSLAASPAEAMAKHGRPSSVSLLYDFDKKVTQGWSSRE